MNLQNIDKKHIVISLRLQFKTRIEKGEKKLMNGHVRVNKVYYNFIA